MAIPTETIIGVFGMLTGGGVVGIITQLRKAKKDTLTSNFEYIQEWNLQFKERESQWTKRAEGQDEKIAKMNRELGELNGRLLQSLEHNAAKDAKILSLESDLARVTAELLSERATATALAATAMSSRGIGENVSDRRARVRTTPTLPAEVDGAEDETNE